MPLSGFDTFLEARYNQVQGDSGSAEVHSDHVRSHVLVSWTGYFGGTDGRG